MVRTPYLPIESFLNILCQQDLAKSILTLYEEDELLREAIAIASPSLYKTLNKKERGSKEDRQTFSSLFKYLLRMSTRPTPFGFFSFISTGSWKDKTAQTIDLKKVYKRARPDMEWLLTVIDQLSKDPAISSILPVRASPILYSSGGKTFVDYIQKKKDEDQAETISIRSTFLTEFIFIEAKSPISIKELKEKIFNRFPELNREKVNALITTLLEKQFLCSALVPSLLSKSPIEDLFSILDSISIVLPESVLLLKNIISQIAVYNQLPLGQGETLLEETQDKMKKMTPSTNLLQVDIAYNEHEIGLPNIVAKELEETIEIGWKLSLNNQSAANLKTYHSKFLDKYGTTRLVPLLELLNEDTGLGVPESYQGSQHTLATPKEKLWTKWLKHKYSECLSQGKNEILLTGEIIDKLIGKPDKQKAVLSFDVFCEVFADSISKIEEGDFLVLISSNTWHAGSTIGRFLDLLGNRAEEQIKELFLKEEALEKRSLFVESSYIPSTGRLANTAIHENFRKYAIDLGGGLDNSDKIHLNDIFVGAKLDRLYLTKRGSTQELFITVNNLLNPTYAPTPLRFIRDVTRSKYIFMAPFSWGELDEMSFLPRVRFNKTIFAPAQWKLGLLQLNLKEKDNVTTIKAKFQEWANLWNLPRYYYLTEGYDNRILIDGKNETHVEEVALQIKKRGEVKLVEKIGQEKGQWVQSQQGTHLAELVIPFIKNEKFIEPDKFSAPALEPSETIDRSKIMGSDWLYAKCYLRQENEDSFLIEHCHRFGEYLLQNKLIKQWFFVRYSDPKPHLRIRFQADQAKVFEQLIPAFHNWSSTLLQGRFVQDIVISTYEREIERYGGKELIESAEDLFCADTLSAIPLIHAITTKKTNLKEEVLVALSLIDMLKLLGFNHQEQINFFQSQSLDRQELEGFREWKKPLLTFGQAIIDEKLATYPDMTFLHEIFEMRKDLFSLFKTKLKDLEMQRKLTSNVHMIKDSILHMHCNRILGRDAKRERKARLYAYQTLVSLEGMKTRNVDTHLKVLESSSITA